MKTIYDIVNASGNDLSLQIQTSSMSEEERLQFIAAFKPSPLKTTIGFCVMGGMFSEGVDLKDDRCIGVFIIGAGVPQICFERDLIREYFNNHQMDGYNYAYMFPGSVKAIAPLVGKILVESEKEYSRHTDTELYLFYNRFVSGAQYTPVSQRLLPLDEIWQKTLIERHWPKGNLPQIIDTGTVALQGLIDEYLFVSLFQACAESLASENASRLAAMQRADKNISEMLQELSGTFHRLRQDSIDEELFDVISGFEALNAKDHCKNSTKLSL
jgi:hypothetical protein